MGERALSSMISFRISPLIPFPDVAQYYGRQVILVLGPTMDDPLDSRPSSRTSNTNINSRNRADVRKAMLPFMDIGKPRSHLRGHNTVFTMHVQANRWRRIYTRRGSSSMHDRREGVGKLQGYYGWW